MEMPWVAYHQYVGWKTRKGWSNYPDQVSYYKRLEDMPAMSDYVQKRRAVSKFVIQWKDGKGGHFYLTDQNEVTNRAACSRQFDTRSMAQRYHRNHAHKRLGTCWGAALVFDGGVIDDFWQVPYVCDRAVVRTKHQQFVAGGGKLVNDWRLAQLNPSPEDFQYLNTTPVLVCDLDCTPLSKGTNVNTGKYWVGQRVWLKDNKEISGVIEAIDTAQEPFLYYVNTSRTVSTRSYAEHEIIDGDDKWLENELNAIALKYKRQATIYGLLLIVALLVITFGLIYLNLEQKPQQDTFTQLFSE